MLVFLVVFYIKDSSLKTVLSDLYKVAQSSFKQLKVIMSNFNNINEKYEQIGQVDYLSTGSQSYPTEALDIAPPSSLANNENLNLENFKSFTQA